METRKLEFVMTVFLNERFAHYTSVLQWIKVKFGSKTPSDFNENKNKNEQTLNKTKDMVLAFTNWEGNIAGDHRALID